MGRNSGLGGFGLLGLIIVFVIIAVLSLRALGDSSVTPKVGPTGVTAPVGATNGPIAAAAGQVASSNAMSLGTDISALAAESGADPLNPSVAAQAIGELPAGVRAVLTAGYVTTGQITVTVGPSSVCLTVTKAGSPSVASGACLG